MKAEFTPYARVYGTTWQQLLRQSISLYWSLGTQANPEVERSLGEVESQMVWLLLQDTHVTPEAVAQAWDIVGTAQTRFLTDMQYGERPPMLADCTPHPTASGNQPAYGAWQLPQANLLAA